MRSVKRELGGIGRRRAGGRGGTYGGERVTGARTHGVVGRCGCRAGGLEVVGYVCDVVVFYSPGHVGGVFFLRRIHLGGEFG